MTRKTPGLAGSESARGQSPFSFAQGASPDSSSPASREAHLIVEKLEEVDYESNTLFPAWEDEEDEMRQRRDVSPARILRTPCPFPDLSTYGEVVLPLQGTGAAIEG
ncbi:hypothetical protein Plhal304r1_c002g0008381 [Plasmopara halstedii]